MVIRIELESHSCKLIFKHVNLSLFIMFNKCDDHKLEKALSYILSNELHVYFVQHRLLLVRKKHILHTKNGK
jgi:hypothetical protein